MRRSLRVVAEWTDQEFYRWFGPWEPLDPSGVAALMDGFSRPWWIVGGWAVEAFTGQPREHEDIDLSILSCDVPALREHVGDAWCLWSNRSGTLRPLNEHHPDVPSSDCQIWFRRDAGSPWVVDLPLTPDRDGRWTNKRLGDHVVPVEEATWLAEDGIRYLNPEISLHFKARQLRAKDARDLEATWPRLDEGRRTWLLRAIETTEGPEHPWLLRDGASG
jgi:hypothetical protein